MKRTSTRAPDPTEVAVHPAANSFLFEKPETGSLGTTKEDAFMLLDEIERGEPIFNPRHSLAMSRRQNLLVNFDGKWTVGSGIDCHADGAAIASIYSQNKQYNSLNGGITRTDGFTHPRDR
jgi:hypothetical protein